MPKILLIGNYPYDRQYSMQRFSNLMRSTLEAAGYEVSLIRPEPIFGKLYPARTGFGKWLGYIDKFILFPIKLVATVRRDRSQSLIVHICDHSNAMYGGLLGYIPYLVTVHDLLAVRRSLGEMGGSRTRVTGRLLQAWVRRALRRAQYCVCVSQQTERDLLRLVDRSGLPTTVISNAIDPMFLTNPSDKHVSPDRSGVVDICDKYVLHVGSNSWYKNRLGVLRIFVALRAKVDRIPKLIMVGPTPSAEMLRLVEAFELEDSVLFVKDASSSRLRRFYQQAELLLFPSIAEGFGWPVVEAQVLGCPVVTSDRPPMTEIGGSAARYCNPDDPVSAAGVVAKILYQTPQERAEMIRAGRVNAGRFSVPTMQRGYAAVYRSLLQTKDARLGGHVLGQPRRSVCGLNEGE